MKFFKVDYILAVAEEKSFTRAAAKLFITQPALSQYIMGVEKELGVELFDRRSSPVQLTFAGDLFVQTANQMMSLQNQFINQIGDLVNMKSGRFSLGISSFRSSCILPRVMSEFKKQWPDIGVSLVFGLTSELGSFALDGKTDIFLTVESELNKNLFNFEMITKERIVLAVPRESPVNKGLEEYRLSLEDIATGRLSPPHVKRVPLNRFKDEVFLWGKVSQNMFLLAADMCRRAGFEPHKALHNSNLESLFALSEAGLGVTFIPVTYIKYGNKSKHPVYYSIDDEGAERNLVVAYTRNRYLPLACKEFISTMKRIIR